MSLHLGLTSMQCIGFCHCLAGFVSMDFNKIAPYYSLLESLLEKMKCDLKPFDLKKVYFINESFLTYQVTSQFDAVCTCFFFDCFESAEVKNGIGKIYSLLKEDGIWMNADFRFFHNHALHQRIAHRLLIQFLYGFFHLTTRLTAATLVCVETLACKSGFKVVETFKHAFLPLSSEVYRRY